MTALRRCCNWGLVTAVLLVVACARESEPVPEPAEPAGAAAPVAAAESRTMTFGSYVDLEALFDELSYTPEAWMAGIREVPRLYISQIPERWSQRTVKEIDVLTKKRLFFRLLAPLVLRSNELILQDRKRLVRIGAAVAAAGQPAPADIDTLHALADQYRLEPAEYDDPAALVTELTLRVDVIPLSLALSQAAEESGWGTSRFAFRGNAIFGQWTWGEGIRPAEQRAGRGDYKVAAFDTPLESVQAHARNLNTHPAYGEFRAARAARRQAMETLRGFDLAATLTQYSERGAEYVKTLRSIMQSNKLDAADDAYLGNTEPITLIPGDA